jgi:cold shock CspA family protein
MATAINPYGDGLASERIVEVEIVEGRKGLEAVRVRLV